MPAVPHVETHFTAAMPYGTSLSGCPTASQCLLRSLPACLERSPRPGSLSPPALARLRQDQSPWVRGGYLAGRSDTEHHDSEYRREEREIRELPDVERQEVMDVLMSHGLSREETAPVAGALSKKPKAWVDSMMKCELGLERPDPKRAMTSGTTIAVAYAVGRLIPLVPYIIFPLPSTGLVWSIGITLLALLIFGYVKGHFTGARRGRSALQTMIIGGIAAAVALVIARSISRKQNRILRAGPASKHGWSDVRGGGKFPQPQGFVVRGNREAYAT